MSRSTDDQITKAKGSTDTPGPNHHGTVYAARPRPAEPGKDPDPPGGAIVVTQEQLEQIKLRAYALGWQDAVRESRPPAPAPAYRPHPHLRLLPGPPEVTAPATPPRRPRPPRRTPRGLPGDDVT